MKKLLPYIYLFTPTLVAFANGGDDHGAAVAEPNPEQRTYVMIGVGVVLVLMVVWFIVSKMKK